MPNPTHSIVSNQDGSYSVALISADGGIATTFGPYSTYQAACDGAHRDSQERSGNAAVFGSPIRKAGG